MSGEPALNVGGPAAVEAVVGAPKEVDERHWGWIRHLVSGPFPGAVARCRHASL
jgi:hypothetical protein